MRTLPAALLLAPLLAATSGCLDPQTQAMIDMAEKLQAASKNGTLMDAFKPRVEGQLASQPPGGASTSMTFDDCQSGEPEGFFGVDLVSREAPAVLRVTRDAIDGTRMRLTRAGGQSVALDAKECSLLQADLDKTGTKINGVTLLQGKVALDCHTPDGASLAGVVSFASCHRSATAGPVVASLSGISLTPDTEMAAATALPDHVDVPSLPAAVRALTVRPRARIVGPTVDGETPAAAEAACLDNARSFCREVGWNVREDGRADLEVEVACSGHVMFRENPTAIEIVLPPTDQPSIVLRSKGAVVDTVPVGPRGLRCDLPGPSEARTRTCVERAQSYGTARLAGLLAKSPALSAFAAGKRP